MVTESKISIDTIKNNKQYQHIKYSVPEIKIGSYQYFTNLQLLVNKMLIVPLTTCQGIGFSDLI